MGLRINTNMASLGAQRILQNTSHRQAKQFERISSGQRIVSASDDAAGLSISENLTAQIRSMKQAERNTMDGVSLVQVAEGGLSEISNMLIRMRELSIQASTDTVGDKERGFINEEFKSLSAEIDRIASVTEFNGTPLLNGEAKDELELQVGIRNNPQDRIVFAAGDNNVRTDALGISDISTLTTDDARDSIDLIDNGLGRVNETRAKLGAMQNKLHATTNNLNIYRENLSNARSRIADADIAEETSNLVRENILQSAGVAVLSQANQAPKQALNLL